MASEAEPARATHQRFGPVRRRTRLPERLADALERDYGGLSARRLCRPARQPRLQQRVPQALSGSAADGLGGHRADYLRLELLLGCPARNASRTRLPRPPLFGRIAALRNAWRKCQESPIRGDAPRTIQSTLLGTHPFDFQEDMIREFDFPPPDLVLSFYDSDSHEQRNAEHSSSRLLLFASVTGSARSTRLVLVHRDHAA
jgi:hypothetical protein